MIRTVGRRKTQNISSRPSAKLLKEGAMLNEMINDWPGENTNHIPKGVYCFHSHEEMFMHKIECTARGMVKLARERKNGQ